MTTISTPPTPFTTADRLVLGFARHWLLIFNLFIAFYVGLPFLAPVLMRAGLTGPAKVLYTVYSPLCHQLGYRSWFLFGEESNYPRRVFQSTTGIDPNDLWAARNFLGDEQLGFKVAFCQRDVAIYGAMLVVGMIYGIPLVRARLKPLHWVGWILLGLVPIGLDGFSQLLSQPPLSTLIPLFSILPQRESDPFLRTLTGSLFGLANVWLAYPYVQESMRDARQELERRLELISNRNV